ncbi:MAG: hypothetical protein MJ059_04110 [Lachnospiraceae bacterium]|nr:hypothetical protein [Lachnospiraceae bacterium]
MNRLKVGFSRENINPPLGIGVHGYFVPRFASKILDDLYVNAIALTTDEAAEEEVKVWNPDTGRYNRDAKKAPYGNCVLMYSIDNCGINAAQCLTFRKYISKLTGVPVENIFLQCTHTHTGPFARVDNAFEVDPEPIEKYAEFLMTRLADSGLQALMDMKPARMGFCEGVAPDRVAYIRRYKMKDGTTWTCPPIEDPDIDHVIGELDQRVNVLRFDREGADTIVMMNYGLHADCLNLDAISPDWPGWMSRTFEAAVPGTKCVFFNGCEGDVGSTHVWPEGGDMNDTFISFDNEMKSEGMARFVGRALCGTILQVYDKVEYVDVDEVKMLSKTLKVAANVPKPEELPRAHQYKEWHDAGRDDLIPYTAMELTTVVAEALRMCRLENGPEFFDLTLSGVKIGPVGFVGIPGEPFTGVGVGIKEAEGWKMICPCCLANGSEAYYPMKEAFDEGGYEARSSDYKGGVAEEIIRGGKELLDELK